MKAADVEKALKKAGTPKKAKASAWFFKTGKGEYGEGDVFAGVTVPEQRKIARRYALLPLSEIRTLLRSPIHECRLTALFVLVGQYQRADQRGKERIAKFYLANRKRVNNWDLVDSSAPNILGDHLLTRDRAVVYTLANSKSVWDRRIALLSTLTFIRKDDHLDTLKLAEQMLGDKHDLIHKAAGWMLREVGERSRIALELFLRSHAASMPRTMLRYAIEKLPERERRSYLAQK